MKRANLLIICFVLSAFTTKAQNADMLYFNSLNAGYDYQAGSFVIDTALPAYPFRRAMLLWAANTGPNAATERFLSLDETLDDGTTVTQHINQQTNALFRNLQPKKIIRSRFTKHYYLLAHVINSSHPINNILVASSAFVLKLDDNLNLVWSSKIHLNPVTVNNAPALLEFNDIIETRDSNLVITGRFARTQTDRQVVQMVKLTRVAGALVWQFHYAVFSCHANGLSVAEASNGELAVTGYAEQCTPPLFTGNRQLLYLRTQGTGFPIQIRKFLHPRAFSGDKITRFISVAGADRFFITGFIDIQIATGAINRQNLVVDISQNGNINRAAHFGDARSEEVNDHIFSRLVFPANTFELYLTGYTTSYTTNTASEAYFSVLRYNSATLVFNITRYDVLRNNYPGTTFISRRGIEVKNAGPRRFAILTNAVFNANNYNHAITTVFVRDLARPASDTACYRPQKPPLDTIVPPRQDTLAYIIPPYARYTEIWTITPKDSNRLVCGPAWKIFPGQAINAMVNPPDQIAPDATTVTARQTFMSTVKTGGLVFPNPAKNEVTITLNREFALTPKPISISLLSPEMKRLRTENISYKTYHTLSLQGLLPGMYFIEVLQGNNKKVYRFVKE
jgi:Secretion system C-terminal sorting domain